MPGGKGGPSKWNVNLDKYVMKWWLESDVIDLKNSKAWDALRADLNLYANVGINTSVLQSKWVNSIDLLLDQYFAGIVKSRDSYGYTDVLSSEDKLNILTDRLIKIKDHLRENNSPLPFVVEPKRKQARIDFTPSPSTDAKRVYKSSSNTPTSSTSCSRRTHSSDLFCENSELVKRHKLDFDRILPMEFRSQEEGAESIDVKGSVLPKQIFKGKSFYLLQDVDDYVGKCYFNTQMYLVQVHGGIVVERTRDLLNETLFIGPESGRLTDIVCKNRNIYSSSLVHEHAKNQTRITEASLKRHILHEKSEISIQVPKLEKVKKEKGSEVVIDLTSDDDVLDDGKEKATTQQKNEDSTCGSTVNDGVIIVGASSIEKAKEADLCSFELRSSDTESNSSTVVKQPITAIRSENILGTVTPNSKHEISPVTKQLIQPSPTKLSANVPNLCDFGKELLGNNPINLRPSTWTEAEKRYAFSLLFKHSVSGTSGVQICRDAAQTFYDDLGLMISVETLRTRVKKLQSEKESCKNLFASLKDEFNLTEEMLVSFEGFFMDKSTQKVASGTKENNERLTGLEAIDESMRNNE